ncbi:MAG: DUF4405 domain-containing protein [Oscillibacter sp.]|nr:DUF4405 domain-containing protein [Oscillibacter sp.]MBQ9618369.1 DUF4405 domain-containing protein [Oscillibacter sp.]
MGEKMRISGRRALDILLTVMLPLQMAYSLIGETYHEAEGVILFALFLAHHAMHANWWRNLFRGRYNAYRVFNTAVNVALSVVMLCLPLSGIAMSKHLFTFLPTAGLAADARAVHMCLAYWGYVLMCVHLGLHADAMLKRKPRWLRYPVAAVSLYGAFAFVRREIPAYMFLRSQFAFFDFSEPRMFFFADYLAVMVLFSAAAYWIGKRLKSRQT